MPIMLATYSTNKILVLKRCISERRKKTNINQTNTRTQTNSFRWSFQMEAFKSQSITDRLTDRQMQWQQKTLHAVSRVVTKYARCRNVFITHRQPVSQQLFGAEYCNCQEASRQVPAVCLDQYAGSMVLGGPLLLQPGVQHAPVRAVHGRSS